MQIGQHTQQGQVPCGDVGIHVNLSQVHVKVVVGVVLHTNQGTAQHGTTG